MAEKVFIQYSSTQLARVAARGLRNPQVLSTMDIRALCGSALTQARQKGKGVILIRPPKRGQVWSAEET